MRLALVLIALALGAPTSAQRHAIEQAFSGYVRMPNSPAAKDNKIVSISVSKLDSRYAVARTQSKTAGPAMMLFHRSLGTWWVVNFGSDLGCDSAPKAVLDELKVGCSPPNGVAWIDACGPIVWQPKSLVLACGDGNYGLDRLVWRGWGRGTSTAAGFAFANDCKPYCAAGHFHSYPVTVSVDRLTRCGLAQTYRRVIVTYPAARPEGFPPRDVRTLVC